MTLRNALVAAFGLSALLGPASPAVAGDFSFGISFGYADDCYDDDYPVVVGGCATPVPVYRSSYYYQPWPYRAVVAPSYYYGGCGPRPVVTYRSAPRYYHSTKVYRRSYASCAPRPHHYARPYRAYAAPRHHYRPAPRAYHAPRQHHGGHRYNRPHRGR